MARPIAYPHCTRFGIPIDGLIPGHRYRMIVKGQTYTARFVILVSEGRGQPLWVHLKVGKMLTKARVDAIQWIDAADR